MSKAVIILIDDGTGVSVELKFEGGPMDKESMAHLTALDMVNHCTSNMKKAGAEVEKKLKHTDAWEKVH